MNRCVQPEWLDELPVTDPAARGSRRDLRRLNRWMGHAGILARELRSFRTDQTPMTVVEFGAGDGHFLSRVAALLGPGWGGTRALLLDRQNIVSEETSRRFRELGWEMQPVARDVFEWCREIKSAPASALTSPPITIANLFLHHFEREALRELFQGLAKRARCLIALEPRRDPLALLFSRMVGLIGCNSVTRHDAPVSVQAGFSGQELSQLWPLTRGWTLRERRAGLFSHLFVALRQVDP